MRSVAMTPRMARESPPKTRLAASDEYSLSAHEEDLAGSRGTGRGSSTAAASVPVQLVISGAFHTTSARAVSSSEEGCGFRTKTRTLIYQSEALRIGRGPAVAGRVEFLIPQYRGRGRYNARIRAPYGGTAVQVVTGRNAATGVGNGFYVATFGSVGRAVKERRSARAQRLGRRHCSCGAAPATRVEASPSGRQLALPNRAGSQRLTGRSASRARGSRTTSD